MKINGNDYAVTINDIEENKTTVTVNGQEYSVEVEGLASKPKTPKVVQKSTVASTDSHPSVARTTSTGASSSAAMSIKSPLPGVILEVLVREGDSVKIGQKLMVLEAMKMENNIESDKEGVVKSIIAHKGDSVLEGDVLITIG